MIEIVNNKILLFIILIILSLFSEECNLSWRYAEYLPNISKENFIAARFKPISYKKFSKQIIKDTTDYSQIIDTSDDINKTLIKSKIKSIN